VELTVSWRLEKTSNDPFCLLRGQWDFGERKRGIDTEIWSQFNKDLLNEKLPINLMILL